MDNNKLAQEIFNLIGPADNIIEIKNCMTRLRVQLKAEAFSESQLKSLPGVFGVNRVDSELQIVLGPGKAAAITTLVKELMEQATTVPTSAPSRDDTFTPYYQVGDGAALHEAIRAKNATPWKLALKKISNIFVPIIPGFIGCGLITGILNIIFKLDPATTQEPLLQVLAVAGAAVFWGLNLFVGVNAAKEFGGSPIIGGVLAAILTNPALGQITIMGQHLVPGRGGIIAVVLVAFFGAWLEQRLQKSIPEMFSLFLTPLFTILISTVVALAICQPIGGLLSEAIGYGATESIRYGGPVTGFILGGTFLPMVMVGIHQGLTPIHAELLNRSGVTILLPILAMAGAGQVGAAAAVYLRTKNQRIKKTIASALPVGLMGVGEPLIYGVTLPLGKPFIGACIGGACGGAVQAYGMVGASTLGISGLPLAASTDNVGLYLIGLVVGYVGGFIATYIIGFDDPKE